LLLANAFDQLYYQYLSSNLPLNKLDNLSQFLNYNEEHILLSKKGSRDPKEHYGNFQPTRLKNQASHAKGELKNHVCFNSTSSVSSKISSPQ
jgi:hypothetical protein